MSRFTPSTAVACPSRRDVANTINRARYASPLGGLPPRDIEDEDQQSRDYSYRLADAVLALYTHPSPQGGAEPADRNEGWLAEWRRQDALYTHPIGETGGTDELIERANNGHNDPTLCRALAAALTSLRAERDELKELVQRNYSLWFSEKMRAEAAESSLAAERLKVAKLTADCVTWRKTFDRIEQEAAKDAQRVAALVGALLWIDNTDPEIVAAAEEKFGFKLASEA